MNARYFLNADLSAGNARTHINAHHENEYVIENVRTRNATRENLLVYFWSAKQQQKTHYVLIYDIVSKHDFETTIFDEFVSIPQTKSRFSIKS